MVHFIWRWGSFFKLRSVLFTMIITYVRFLDNIVYRMEQNSLTLLCSTKRDRCIVLSFHQLFRGDTLFLSGCSEIATYEHFI
jgi:hypothetical protein